MSLHLRVNQITFINIIHYWENANRSIIYFSSLRLNCTLFRAGSFFHLNTVAVALNYFHSPLVRL